MTPSDAGLLYVIYRMNAPRPPQIPKYEHVWLRSQEEQAWELVDTDDWVIFVSFVNSFYFLDPCDRLKKKKKTTAFRNAWKIPWIRPWGKCGAYTLVHSTSIENEEEGWPPSQKQCSIRASRRAFNYAQGKTDTETNFVVTVGFTTKVDHQTTSKISYVFHGNSGIL